MKKFYYFAFSIFLITACAKGNPVPTSINTPNTPSPTLTSTPTISPIPTVSPTITHPPTVTLSPTPTLEPISQTIKGIGYRSLIRGQFDQPYTNWTLKNIIQPMGVNWISIQFTCHQKNFRSLEVSCEYIPDFYPQPISKHELASVIQKAHSLGIRVLLEIFIELTDDSSHFAGHIGQGFSDEQWESWFKSYQTFITDYAKLAEEYDVDMLSIGTELVSTTHREKNWRETAKAVREVYHGLITYSETPLYGRPWFESIKQITWWDAVDVIGIHPYDYVMSKKNDPTVNEMVANLQPMVDELEQISKEYNRPVVITELDIASLDEVNRGREYIYDDPNIKLDVQEQADIYQAYIEAFSSQDWWYGGFLSPILMENLYSDSSNIHVSIIGKPAENVMRSFTGALPVPTVKPIPTPDLEKSTFNNIYIDALDTYWYHYPGYSHNIDFKQSDIAYSGNAIEANVPAWNGLIFGPVMNSEFGISSYQWLEFYIYLPKVIVSGKSWHEYDPVSIVVKFKNDSFRDATPFGIDIAYSKYIEGHQLIANRWQRVLIPLEAFGPVLSPVNEIIITNNTWQTPIQFYIDNLRFIREKNDPQ